MTEAVKSKVCISRMLVRAPGAAEKENVTPLNHCRRIRFWTNLKLANSWKAFNVTNTQLSEISFLPNNKMISTAAARAAQRTTTSLVTRRAFHATRARLSSPYHYPEGAYTNIPFNPKTKFFFVRYWLFMATGFFAPFGIAAWQTYKPR